MSFSPSTVQVRSGTWNFHFEKHGTLFHDLTIESSNGTEVLGATAAQPGQSGDFTVTLGRGRYVMVCLEPGHRRAGMIGEVDIG